MSFTDPGFETMSLDELKEWLGSNDLSAANYSELLNQLTVDLPTALPGVVQSSIGGSSGSVSAPAQGSTLEWDAGQQLYVPSNGAPASGSWQWTTNASFTNGAGNGFTTYLSETLTLTTPNPRLLWLVNGSAYASAGATPLVTVGTQIDGGAWVGIGTFYFNSLNIHLSFGPFRPISTPTRGTHTFAVGLSATGGNITTDSNDTINFTLLELPAY